MLIAMPPTQPARITSWLRYVSWSVGAVIKCFRSLIWNGSLLFTVLEAGQQKIKEPANAVSGKDAFPVPQLLLPPHTAEVEKMIPWTCHRRPKPTQKSKDNTLSLQHLSLNRSKGEGSVMTCTEIILRCKKCFNISHVMPTLIQLLAHFVD